MDGQKMKSLIKKAKHGDCESFGILYAEYMKELYRFALYVLKKPEDAEDAVQNAAIIAFKKIGSLKKDDSFKSWFFKILFNECRKIIFSKSRVREMPCEDIGIYDESIPDFSSGSDLLSLLDELNERDKSIVILSVFDNLTSEEIAEILSMKPATVRSRLSRLLFALRKQIEGVNNEK